MTNKKYGINPGSAYDDINIPEIDLPGRGFTPNGENRYGDIPIGDPNGNDPDSSDDEAPSEDNDMLWVAPPVPMSDQKEGRWKIY